jgi:Ca2+/Na+ antiporter
MERFAILIGVLLCGLGLLGYFVPTAFGEVGPEGASPTALIPAGIGAAILICGLIVTMAPHTRKHAMHLAAAIALLGAIGGFMPLRRKGLDLSQASVVAAVIMIALCVIFVILCIRSFVRARIARSQGLPESPRAE